MASHVPSPKTQRPLVLRLGSGRAAGHKEQTVSSSFFAVVKSIWGTPVCPKLSTVIHFIAILAALSGNSSAKHRW